MQCLRPISQQSSFLLLGPQQMIAQGAPATHVEAMHEVPGSWLCPGSALAFAAMWGSEPYRMLEDGKWYEKKNY